MGLLVFIAFFCLWFANSLLMLTQPRRWATLMYIRPLRPMGLRVEIDDERRLARISRLVGTVLLLAGLVMMGLMAVDLTTLGD